MSYSSEFKINVNKLNADEAILVLLEITHPYLSEPLRLVNDNKDIVSMSNNYMAMPFDITRQDDIQGELPQISLKISNVGRSLVKWIDSSGGGRNSVISLKLVRRSSPDLIEENLVLGIQRITISTEIVSFSLIVQNNLVKRAMKYIYEIKRSPGLF